ncbi:amidohydrolase [Tissierella carlieri]|uniref:M20 family metallopeptidase n=1 Tax=Tissierella carlieri TaxID=689904 RepID=A0ABT1S7G5_9FIRM|nr:M20 family metallopeptidase [Tissierella carlieri]MBU5312634.1 amidohydrolase [Tissierella carlieri]MCQ4922401.1 M20 family metallopeptidase [Tissierella carlieri]
MLNIIQEVNRIEEDIISWRRELHQIPEIGLDLPRTTKFIMDELDNMNIEYHTLVNGNAIVGLIKGKEEGKTIGLRADTDALPVKEKTGLEFASNNGCMHACGHDGHTAILLGVAKVLNENKDKFKGNVKLLFQPGEEYPGGAKPMIEEGALENPKVDVVMGLHLGNLGKEIPKGKIGVSYGAMMAAVDVMYIKINGKGSHGAYPHQSIDPIVTASEIVLALQTIISREVDPVEPAVVSVTRIDGGFNHNIIPDSVEIQGTIRTVNEETRQRISRRIEEIVKGITLAHGASYEIDYEFCYPALINSEEFTKGFVESAKKIIPEEDIIEMKSPVMGAEDMSFFLQEVPGTFFYLSNMAEIDGEFHPHHNPKFDIDEGEMWKGAALIIQNTIDWLNKN